MERTTQHKALGRLRLRRRGEEKRRGFLSFFPHPSLGKPGEILDAFSIRRLNCRREERKRGEGGVLGWEKQEGGGGDRIDVREKKGFHPEPSWNSIDGGARIAKPEIEPPLNTRPVFLWMVQLSSTLRRPARR